MKFRPSCPALAAAGLLSIAGPAAAHVDYFDFGANLFVDANGASFDQEMFNDAGWHAGTLATLGDSHDLAVGVFFKFHLAGAARVTITFSDTDNSGLLNPAFSLYAGLLPGESHDDTRIDALNPSHLVATPFPHVVKDAALADDGVALDADGDVSPLRDTANASFDGQFNALGDWSMANADADVHCLTQPGGACNATALAEAAAAGEWSVIRYLTHVAPQGGNAVALVDHLLAAGDYTIAAGGGMAAGASNVVLGTLTFKASPVPAPGMVWMFGATLVGLAARRRR